VISVVTFFSYNGQCPSRLTVRLSRSYDRGKKKKITLVLTVATLVVGSASEALVLLMLGIGGVRVWRESGVRLLVLC
jgi:hypothetical protein